MHKKLDHQNFFLNTLDYLSMYKGCWGSC